ncbi:MAG: T9SS type A sorting domain-containing protein [Chitinophagaceae bacterium]
MKKLSTHLLLTVLIVLCTSQILNAQNKISQEQVPVSGSGKINFSDLAKKELANPPKLQPGFIDKEEKSDRQIGIPVNQPVGPNAKVTQINLSESGVTNQLSVSSPAPTISFDGLLDNGAVIPPDVNGSVGPSSIFETLNSQYRILNKTGGTISTLSLASFWSGLSGTPFSDPHIVYDATSGRWLACIIGQLTSGHYAMFIAASLTSDPSGSWYEYSIDTGPSSTIPDYPLLGYNMNWVVITTNNFVNNVYSKVRINILNKSSLYSGSLGTATIVYDANYFTLSPAETLDGTQSTEYLLTDYNGNSGGNGYVALAKITGTPSSPVYAEVNLIGVNQPWSETAVNAPQLGTNKKILTNDARMRTVIYQGGSLWATHTVYMPASSPNRASTDWWQINPATSGVQQFGRIDDPTKTFFYAFPSLAVTTGGNLLVGFSVFGKSIYASSGYAYRNASDPSGSIRNVYTYQAGKASYNKTFGSGRNRWGDYSATCIDPANGTFWTVQEYATTPKNNWATSWANVTSSAAHATTPVTESDNQIKVYPNPATNSFAIQFKSGSSGVAEVNLFDNRGKAVYNKTVNVVKGINIINMEATKLYNGNYTINLHAKDESIKTAQIMILK